MKKNCLKSFLFLLTMSAYVVAAVGCGSGDSISGRAQASGKVDSFNVDVTGKGSSK